jgi:ribonuclease P/MRP protein subunit POP8
MLPFLKKQPNPSHYQKRTQRQAGNHRSKMSTDPELLPDATESTAITLPTTQAPTSSDPATAAAAAAEPHDASKKKTRKRKRKPKKSTITTHFIIRSPQWSSIHLQHLSPTSSEGETSAFDALIAHNHLTAALSQFLGLHGEAITIDILKVEGTEVWIRVPAADKAALIAAAGGWISRKGEGWRVIGTSSWDARAVARDGGQDLFND